MQVILTPTAVADKFGVGLNGFAGDVPGPPTQVSTEFLDSVQMEIVNVILGQSIALDGLVFTQLKTAIDNYTFLDPSITNSLTVKAGGSLLIASTAVAYIQSGGALVLENGSTLAIEANVSLFASDQTWVWGSSNTNDWTINGNVTLGTDAASSLTIPATIDAKVSIAANDALAFLLNVTNAGIGGGIKSLTVGGYAGYFQTDTTSPVNAALFLMPQDNDPSSPTAGDLYHHSTRGKLRIRNFSQWESVHSSPNGSVFGCTATADQLALVGTTGNVAGVVILPEVAGNVLVTGSFFWIPSVDTDTVTFILRDNTAGVNITQKVIRAKDVDAVGARGETVVLRRVYALPSTASRTFVLNITTAGGGADVQDIVLSVQGVT